MQPRASALTPHGRRSRGEARRHDEPGSTRARIIAATAETLRVEGFAGTSARAIAAHGGFNQALIFYHFGGIIDVLVATLEQLSADRLAEYRAAVANVPDLRAAVRIARRQYRADVREGHITVLVELLGGASAVPELGPQIVRCMAPWLAFAEETIRLHVQGSALERLIPPREAAQALVAIYLGMELLDHLDEHSDTAGPLFRVAERLLAGVEPILHGQSRRVGGRLRPERLQLDGARLAAPAGGPRVAPADLHGTHNV